MMGYEFDNNGNNNGKHHSSSEVSVSVVIPTLNEAKNLPLVLPYIPLDVVNEVILVDGRSKDDTIEVAKRLLPSLKVVLEETPGKGAALRRGYEASTGDIIVVLDADGSNDPREIPRLVRALMEGADFVKGSRFAPLGGTTDMPRLRKLGNWGFVKLVNILFSQKFTDLCYGMHAFWRYSLDYLDLSSVNGFEVDTAIYLQAVRKKLRIIDVPSFEGFRFYGEGKLQTFPDGWRVLRTIFREWMMSIKEPSGDPQVGFRGYARRPISAQKEMEPAVEKGNGRVMVVEAGRRLSLDQNNLEDLFRSIVSGYSGEELQQRLQNFLLFSMETLGASSGSLIVTDKTLDIAKSYLVYGRTVEIAERGEIHNLLDEGVAGWVVRNKKPVLIQNTSNDPRWLRRSWDHPESASRSALVIPFVIDGQVVAVLTLSRPEDRSFTEEDLSRFQTMMVKA